MLRRAFLSAAALVALSMTVRAAEKSPEPDMLASMKPATIALKSAPALAFGPQGVLFAGDPAAATIYAIDTGDRTPSTAKDGTFAGDGLSAKIADLLGTDAAGIRIADMAVNPISGKAYLSVARGAGPMAGFVVLSVDPAGKVAELSLKDVKSASVTLSNASTKARQEAITHMAYNKGRLLVAGLSNEEFASNLRSIPCPFDKTDRGSSVEIYHGAHGALETRSPIRVFTTYQIKGEDNLLAAYTCTPLVKLPVNTLKPGEKLKAVTVAELGNRNKPLSIIVYRKGEKDYALMANSARGVMKVALDGIADIEGISKRVSGTAGLKYETIKDLTGVQKLDAFGKTHALLLVVADKKASLKAVELP